MDRERDRDAAEALIEEHDEKAGGGEPERTRPGENDPKSRPVDGRSRRSKRRSRKSPRRPPARSQAPSRLTEAGSTGFDGDHQIRLMASPTLLMLSNRYAVSGLAIQGVPLSRTALA